MRVPWIIIGQSPKEPIAERKNRGLLTFVQGGAGAVDRLRFLRKNTADAYERVDIAIASEVATVGHNHDSAYVNVAGDTMTGALTVQNNVTVEGNASLGNGDGDLTTITGRLRVAGTEPSVAFGTGAGTGPANNGFQGTDTAGRFVFTTGTTPAANQVIATVTFAQQRPDTNYTVYITPTDADAAASVGTGNLWFDESGRLTTSFTVRSGAAGLAASTSYRINYLVVEFPADA